MQSVRQPAQDKVTGHQCMAKCLHCVRTACILRTHRPGYSPKNTCHLFTRGRLKGVNTMRAWHSLYAMDDCHILADYPELEPSVGVIDM